MNFKYFDQSADRKHLLRDMVNMYIITVIKLI